MNRALAFGVALALIAAGALAARPLGELPLFLQLNGHPTRWVQTDGGASGLYGDTSAIRCMPLTSSGGTGVTAPVLKLTPNVPINLCVRPALGGTLSDYINGWDGGCNNIAGDMNFGDPLQPWQAHYVVPDNNAAWICASGDAGTIATAVYRMR